jgi:hypothetical protein
MVMANTLRESTALYRSENAIESAGFSRIPALGFGPHHSTLVDPIRQEFNHLKLPIWEPMASCITRAVDKAFDSHSRTHGSTVSLIHGNMVGQQLFSVSIYPSRTINLWPTPTWDEIFSFAQANLDRLLKPSHALGSWFNDWKLEHVFDVVVLTSDHDAALELGRRFDQLAIFDLAARREIPILRVPQEATAELVEVGND